MQFSVRHLAPGASVVSEGLMEARDEAELRARLEATGGVILALNAVVRPHRDEASGSRLDVPWWCRELSTLIRAGMSVVEAIDTLASTREGGKRDDAHAQLLWGLRQGQPLSRAMAATGLFPAVLVASVTASERTSTLAEALDDYLQYSESMDRLRRQVVSAAIYPTLVISLGAAISGFLLLYVMPRFARMYHDLQSEASGLTMVVLWVSRTLRESMPQVLAVLGLLAAILAWAWQSGALWRAGATLIERVPALRRPLDEFRLAKLYQSLALMVRGGYTFDEALLVCSTLGLGRRMTAGIERARQEIDQGRSASLAMRSGGLTESVTVRLLAVGERTGSFEDVLRTIAQRHMTSFSTFVERATRIAEPVLLMVVALAVGGIVVMMYVPVFDIASGLQR